MLRNLKETTETTNMSFFEKPRSFSEQVATPVQQGSSGRQLDCEPGRCLESPVQQSQGVVEVPARM